MAALSWSYLGENRVTKGLRLIETSSQRIQTEYKLSVSVSLGCYTKYYRLSSLNRNLFVVVLVARSPKLQYYLALFLVMSCFMFHSQFPSCCVLTWQREKEMSLPLLIKPQSWQIRSILMNSFNFNDIHKGPISKYNSIRGWSFNI